MPDKNGWNKTSETPPPTDVLLEIYTPGYERSFGMYEKSYSGDIELIQKCGVNGWEWEWEYNTLIPEYWRIPCDLPE